MFDRFYTSPRLENENVCAALDLGTNSCRLLTGYPAQGRVQILDAFSVITRLGEGMGANGFLSEEAMERTIRALQQCLDRLASFPVKHSRFITTEASRKAKNKLDFIEKAEKEAGIRLEIISSEEEARLCMCACRDLFDLRKEGVLILDTGGGSTDLSYVCFPQEGEPFVKDSFSIPSGVVSLSESFLGKEPSREEYLQAVRHMADAFAPFEEKHRLAEKIQENKIQMIGMSGTVTTLAAFKMKLRTYSHQKVDGFILTREDIEKVSDEISLMTYEEKSNHRCIGPQRADLTLAGCAILEAVRRFWNPSALTVADRGLREGVLVDLFQKFPLIS